MAEPLPIFKENLLAAANRYLQMIPPKCQAVNSLITSPLDIGWVAALEWKGRERIYAGRVLHTTLLWSDS